MIKVYFAFAGYKLAQQCSILFLNNYENQSEKLNKERKHQFIITFWQLIKISLESLKNSLYLRC